MLKMIPVSRLCNSKVYHCILDTLKNESKCVFAVRFFNSGDYYRTLFHSMLTSSISCRNLKVCPFKYPRSITTTLNKVTEYRLHIKIENIKTLLLNIFSER